MKVCTERTDPRKERVAEKKPDIKNEYVTERTDARNERLIERMVSKM